MALIHEEFARQGYICLYSKGVKKKKNNKIIWDYVFISSLIQNYINSFIFIHQTGLNFYLHRIMHSEMLGFYLELNF